MQSIDREEYTKMLLQPSCADNFHNDLSSDISTILTKIKGVLDENEFQFIATWLLENDLWVNCQQNNFKIDTETLSRGRVITVNPGVTNIGREQRYIHCYIVLGEFHETFIGVPITNMAFNQTSQQYYLRNVFEVELINPNTKKPFTEFRVKKPSIADIRNISGFDKRRIIKNQLYYDKKFAPKTYMDAISEKIRATLALSH